MESSALINNVAGSSAPGIYAESGSVSLKNIIFFHGGVDSLGLAAGAVLTSKGYNISGTYEGGLLAGEMDQPETDPLLELPGLNGGETLSYALQPSSPAVNTGDSQTGTVTGF